MKVTKSKKTNRHNIPKSVRRKLRQNADKKRVARREKLAKIRMTLRFSNKATHVEYINNYIALIDEDIMRISNAVRPVIDFMDNVHANPKAAEWLVANEERVDVFGDQLLLIDAHLINLRKVRNEAEASRVKFEATEYENREDMLADAYAIILSAASVIEQSLIVDNQIADLFESVSELEVNDILGAEE
ncbi:MAG: hypothetical protein ACRDDY_13890 [Clostridium sp.]|uniref:hypothetical protein n=1 Tax=Clostridium sp. TaxID=1506 RepID=UPI003EE640C4